MADYSEWEQEAGPGGNLKAALMDLADQHRDLSLEIEILEEELAEKKKKLKEISETSIPDLMDGMSGKLELDDGRKVAVKETIRANIRADRKPEAFAWLTANGHGAIIKNQIVVEMGKGQEDQTRELISQIANEHPGANVKVNKSVHASTLSSFVNKKLKEGADIPQETLGVYRQRSTKIED